MDGRQDRGLLPLSADPVTYGHLDLINRAAQMVETLLVAILDDPSKTPLFDKDARMAYVQKAMMQTYPDVKNVKYFISSALLTDIYLEEGCDLVFRGVRDKHDMEYENLQIRYHEIALPLIKGHFHIFPANPDLTHVQSTTVREFAKRRVDVTSMTPMFIQARLWRKIHQQKVIGLCMHGCAPETKDKVRGILKEEFEKAKLPLAIISTETFPADLGTGFLSWSPEMQDARLNLLYRQALSKAPGGVVLVEFESPCYVPWLNNNVILVCDTEKQSIPQYCIEAKLHNSMVQHHYGNLIQLKGGPSAPYKTFAEQLALKIKSSEI